MVFCVVVFVIRLRQSESGSDDILGKSEQEISVDDAMQAFDVLPSTRISCGNGTILYTTQHNRHFEVDHTVCSFTSNDTFIPRIEMSCRGHQDSSTIATRMEILDTVVVESTVRRRSQNDVAKCTAAMFARF